MSMSRPATCGSLNNTIVYLGRPSYTVSIMEFKNAR
jgi:hypothetical protein